MSLFGIITLATTVWFVFGFFSVRLATFEYISYCAAVPNRLSILINFLTGPLSWFVGMIDQPSGKQTRRRAHFLPVFTKKVGPNSNLILKAFGMNVDKMIIARSKEPVIKNRLSSIDSSYDEDDYRA